MVQQSTIDRQIAEANKFFNAANPQQYYASKSEGVKRLIDRGLALKGVQRQTPLKVPTKQKPLVLKGTPTQKPLKAVKPSKPQQFKQGPRQKNVGKGKASKTVFYSRHSPRPNIRITNFNLVFPRGLSNHGAKAKVRALLSYIKFKSQKSSKSFYIKINGLKGKTTNGRRITKQAFYSDFVNECNTLIDLYFGAGGITEIDIAITEIL